MQVLKKPGFWLMVWGGAGALAILYFIIAASLKPNVSAGRGAPGHDQALLVGDMAKFAYAFPPRGAPEIAFAHGGEPATLADFRGKTVLVNLWATWCVPCLKELPSLDALEATFGGEDFQVVAIASDPRGAEAAQSFFDRLGIEHLELYLDPNLRLAMALGGANVLPVSVLYGPDGAEIGRLVGEADWMSAEAHALVQSAIR